MLESARGFNKVAEGSFLKPSDLLKSKDSGEHASEHLFDSQKDTASCSQNQQVPQMVPPAPPKLRKNKKKLVASTRLSKVPNQQESKPQPLFQRPGVARVSLNYNKQMNANQSAIQQALKANQEVRRREPEEAVKPSKSFVRQVKSLDRQKVVQNITVTAEKQLPQNSSAPAQDSWLTPAIIPNRVQKSKEECISNFELSTNVIGKRPNNNSIMVSSNDSQVHQLRQAQNISRKFAKQQSVRSPEHVGCIIQKPKSKSIEKTKVG